MSAFFNQTCEYAIRAMMEIARRPQGEYVLAKDLADKLDIPHHYLSKILQQLVRSRILESTRGRLGRLSPHAQARKHPAAGSRDAF
jgi:Rrf2 family protein